MASVILSGTPAIVDIGNAAVPQTLSLAGNTISLSNGGGSVDVAAATSVDLSTQKLTAINYDGGLLETNVDGVLNVGLGSAIGSTRVEGGSVVIERGDAPPRIDLINSNTSVVAFIDHTASELNINAATSGILMRSRNDAANIHLNWDGSSKGNISVSSTDISTGQQSVLQIKPADARLTGADVIVIQSYAAGSLYMDATAGISASAVVGNITLEANTDAASKAILRATAEVEIASTGASAPITINAAGDIGLTANGGTISALTNQFQIQSVDNTTNPLLGLLGPLSENVIKFEEVSGITEITSDNDINISAPTSITLETATVILQDADMRVVGTSPSILFDDATNVQKAAINFSEVNNKLTLECPTTDGEVALVSGTNGIEFNTSATGPLSLSGAALQAASAGGNSGQHLRIKLNGVFYKIKLEND